MVEKTMSGALPIAVRDNGSPALRVAVEMHEAVVAAQIGKADLPYEKDVFFRLKNRDGEQIGEYKLECVGERVSETAYHGPRSPWEVTVNLGRSFETTEASVFSVDIGMKFPTTGEQIWLSRDLPVRNNQNPVVVGPM